MRLRGTIRTGALAAVVLLVATCGGNGVVNPPPPPPPPGPTPGWLSIRLTTPNSDDGGILFVLTGGPIDTLRTTHPQLVLQRETGGAVRVVVVGSLAAGLIAEVLVPDTRQAAAYQGQVQEVAARGTFVQRAAAGYSLSFAP